MENSRVDLKNGNEFLASLTKIHHSFQWISKTFITAKNVWRTLLQIYSFITCVPLSDFLAKSLLFNLASDHISYFTAFFIIKLRQNAVLSSYPSVLRGPPAHCKLRTWNFLYGPFYLIYLSSSCKRLSLKETFQPYSYLEVTKLLSVPAFNFSTWFIYFIICVTSTRHRYFLFLDPELYIYMSWNIKNLCFLIEKWED